MSLSEHIKNILGPCGLLAESMDGYEHRTQQIQMALEVANALTEGEKLVIEAPTGTGKTLAYLVAAVLSRKRVAISTGTKNLQEQLFEKDIPFLKRTVFPELRASLLKGRGNFLCHHRFLRFLRQPYLEGLHPPSLEYILKWYRKTGRKGTGDRSELVELPDDDAVWPEICSHSEICMGSKCPDREDCFVLRMKTRAADADIMVVNHHLLASDLAVREAGFGEVIPRYEAVIIDEAHGFEDALTQHFGIHMTATRITRLINDMRWELREQKLPSRAVDLILSKLEKTTHRLFDDTLYSPGPRTALGPVTPEQRDARDAVCAQLSTLATAVSNLSEHSEKLSHLVTRVQQLAYEIHSILGDEQEDGYARWLERREKSLVLHASPIEVGELLRKKLYEKVSAVIFTSATLSTNGNFEYFKSRMGLDGEPGLREAMLDSPFDHTGQTVLLIPNGLPEPNSPGFIDAVVPVLEDLLTRTGGRAFLLFTSYKNMTAVYEKMRGRLPFPLLVQGSRPRSRLLEEFKAQEGSVLFATASFWEGVDVPGDALSCVVIDRLPFAPPDDPIVAARMARIKKRGGEPFYSFQVPMAVLALKQGLGRLIRTRSDRGILCILDIRIITKPYGKIFKKSIYKSPIYLSLDHINHFFNQKDQGSRPLGDHPKGKDATK